jgi:LysM repeat protein
MELSTDRWAKKFRLLVALLMISGALNIGLLAAFFFTALQEKQTAFAIALPTPEEEKFESTNQQILASFSKLTFSQLAALLTNRELLEEGYAKRDLALAALVSFHDFNIQKALSGPPSQKRLISLSERIVEVYPALNEDQFQAIIRFAYEEKWPLTSKGLHRMLKKSRDESLSQAFSLTQEFHALQVLFQKSGSPQEPSSLVDLASEGSWDLLEQLYQEQSQALDFSIDKRRGLLLSYLALHSPAAAHLLIKTDGTFASKRLEDKGILDLLQLVSQKSPEAVQFCTELLRSSRSDAVWQAAAMRLYTFEGVAIPDPFDLKAAIEKFAPTPLALAETKVQAPPAPKPQAKPPALRRHVVKEGESLWKIARTYKVKVEDLAQLNKLEKDQIRPGMELKIPGDAH